MIIRNAFGKEYEIEELPKKKIQEIIDNLDWQEIIKQTWDNHCDDYGRTEAQLDIETGKIGYAKYTQGSGDIETHFITLYVIEENTLGNSSFQYCGDILDDEECEKVQQMIEADEVETYEEGMEKLGIDFDERFGEYLVWCWYEDDFEARKGEIAHQIKEIYELK